MRALKVSLLAEVGAVCPGFEAPVPSVFSEVFVHDDHADHGGLGSFGRPTSTNLADVALQNLTQARAHQIHNHVQMLLYYELVCVVVELPMGLDQVELHLVKFAHNFRSHSLSEWFQK